MRQNVPLPGARGIPVPVKLRARRALWLPIVAALAAGSAWLFLRTPGGGAPPPTPTPAEAQVAADTAGAVRTWLLAVPDPYEETFVDTFAELIASAHPEVRFHVAHSEPRGRLLLLEHLSEDEARRVTFHRVKRSVTPWVRDAFVVGRARDGSPLAFLPHAERFRAERGPWTATNPTTLVGLLPGLTSRPTGLRVDGGGVVSDEERIFAALSPMDEGVQGGERRDSGAFQKSAEATWGRAVTWIDAAPVAPSAHCDVFLMPAGDRRMVLGDVRLGAALLGRVSAADRARFVERVRDFTQEAPDPDAPPIDHDQLLDQLAEDSPSPFRVAALDAITRQVEGLGYRVVRVPFLVLEPMRYGLFAAFTYTNVVLDARAGKRTVFMPVYGLGPLDAAGEKTWRGLGYEVRRIDALGPAIHGGAIRCVSQVIRD